MKSKSIITVVLLAFVGISVAYLVIQEFPEGSETQSEPEQVADANPETRSSGDTGQAQTTTDREQPLKLMAYYFHRTQRCKTCKTIEAYSEEILKEAFPEALKTGRLEWHAVNVEEPANEHFVEQYELTSGALVLVAMEDGEQRDWNNLERVWELVGDELKFKAYVESAAMAFLGNDS